MIYHNYISTSLVQHFQGFDYNADYHPILFRIIVPKNTHAIYTRSLSRHGSSEIELLIRRNVLLNITDMKITDDDGKEIIVIDAIIINQNFFKQFVDWKII